MATHSSTVPARAPIADERTQISDRIIGLDIDRTSPRAARRRLRATIPALAAAALAVSVVISACGPPPPAGGTPSPALVLDGRGYGHGIGMSQWGAYGLAVHAGQSWPQILAHYYGGTSLATSGPADFAPLPAGFVSVRLQAVDGVPVSVVQLHGQARIAADPVAGRTWSAVAIREIPGQTNRYRVWATQAATCAQPTTAFAAPWSLVADGISGPVTITATSGDAAAAAPADLLGLCQPGTDVRYYRGAIQAADGTVGEDRAVNVVPIQLYLRSVVAGEMSGSWGSAGGGAGMNALRAQAVAARSYALSETSSTSPGLKYPYAKTCDTGCQYYAGAAVGRGGPSATPTSFEDPRATAAVDETAGFVLRDGSGRVSHAYFSASSGGRTALGPYPVVDDPLDGIPENPNHSWRIAIPAAAIESKWSQIGRFVGATITGRDGAGGTWGGRVTTVQVRGTAGTMTVSGADLRTALNLKSTWFNISG